MKDERFAAYIAQFFGEFKKELLEKLSYKRRLEADSSFRIPARIWFAFLTPPSDQELRELSVSCRPVVALKKSMLDAFKNPERFLESDQRGKILNDCVTLCLLEILFDLTERKILLKRPQYDQWIEIAERFGQWRLRYALEDAVFAFFHPEQFDVFQSVVEKQMKTDKQIIADVRSVVTHALEKAGIVGFKILNRQKNIYGVYQKIEKKGLSVNRIFDIHGFRILVRTKEDCYWAFDAINALWPHFRERFKDYIASPKSNGYQSIHTVFSSIEKRPIEFQIRTFEMDAIAESGHANHAAYKKQSSATSSRARP